MPLQRYLPALALVLTISCEGPACRSSSPVFERFPPDNQAYKQELARQIGRAGTAELRFWFDAYRKRDGQEHIIADVRGPGICAKAELQVSDWRGIEGLRGSEPKGYRGAELKGLEMAVLEKEDRVEFIYRGLDRIVD